VPRVGELQAGGQEGRPNVLLAIHEDAGRDQVSVRSELRTKRISQVDEHVRNQVGEDEVVWSASTRQRADMGLQPIANGIARRVCHRCIDRDRIGVEGVDARRTELGCRDREDPRAAAHVEDGRPVHESTVGERFQRDEAETRRRVMAGAEGPAGVELDDDLVGARPVRTPRRLDDEPLANRQDRKVFLPGLGPVGLMNGPRAEFADGSQPECLEVAERLLGSADRRRGRAVVARRDIGADDRRPSGIDPGAETLVDELEGGLDAGPTGREPPKDLADRLDRLGIGFDRQFQPGVVRRWRLGASRECRPCRWP
jgi:hypothetical protein